MYTGFFKKNYIFQSSLSPTINFTDLFSLKNNMSQNLPSEPPILRWSSFFRGNYFIRYRRINKKSNLSSLAEFEVLQKLLLITFFCMNLVILYLLLSRCVHFDNFLCDNCQLDTLSIDIFYFYNKRNLLKI